MGVGVELDLGTPSSPAQPLAHPQFPLKEGSPQEDKDMEEEMEDEDSSFKLCVPGIVTLPSPLRKAFRSSDTVGKSGAPSPSKQLPDGPLWPRLVGAIPVPTTRWEQRT